jgi:drug/metabolite transporter (DMT)-like permease
MTIAIAVVCAMLIGTGFVLQQHAAEQEPQSYFLRFRLIVDLLHRGRWLAGIAIMVIGQVLSIWVVGHLVLSVYEPLIATNLIFALILAVPLSGQRLSRTELIGALILAAGVTILSVSRIVNTQEVRFGSFAYWPAAAAIAAIAFCFVHAGRRRAGQQRATLTAVGSGLIFGISDALTRRSDQVVDAHGFAALFTTWPAYSLVGASLIAMWLMQNSFNAAPLRTSLPAITAAQPVAGIALGVVVFGDVIRDSPWMIALQIGGLVMLVIGVLMVARGTTLSSLRPSHAIRPRRERTRLAPAPPRATETAPP